MMPVALLNFLKPFNHFLEMEKVSDICINRPQEMWVEQEGKFLCFDVPTLTLDYLWQFARLVAEYNEREISRETPVLSSVLPNGLRIHFVVEPACERGSFVCAIRKQSVAEVSVTDYFRQGGDEIIQTGISKTRLDDRLKRAYLAKDYVTFLQEAVRLKKNIIISGGTSTGKTTLLNALLKSIPEYERIITIETDREVRLIHPNRVHLLASQEAKSVSSISMLGLLKTVLRLRPDRIFVSELRDEEVFAYLRAINSGHPGSITTLHADDAKGCFDQLVFMMMQNGSSLSRNELMNYVKSVIPIVVQIKKFDDGKRLIDEIYFNEVCDEMAA